MASTTSARTRTIPRTEQTFTTLGLGTFLTFDARPGDDRRDLGEVFRRYVAGGGRVVDTSPLYGSAEVSVGAFLAGTPEASEIFVANKIWSTGEYLGDESHAVASLVLLQIIQLRGLWHYPLLFPGETLVFKGRHFDRSIILLLRSLVSGLRTTSPPPAGRCRLRAARAGE